MSNALFRLYSDNADGTPNLPFNGISQDNDVYAVHGESALLECTRADLQSYLNHALHCDNVVVSAVQHCHDGEHNRQPTIKPERLFAPQDGSDEQDQQTPSNELPLLTQPPTDSEPSSPLSTPQSQSDPPGERPPVTPTRDDPLSAIKEESTDRADNGTDTTTTSTPNHDQQTVLSLLNPLVDTPDIDQPKSQVTSSIW